MLSKINCLPPLIRPLVVNNLVKESASGSHTSAWEQSQAWAVSLATPAESTSVIINVNVGRKAKKLCWKWNQALLPLPEAHKSSELMVPQNRSDWLQRGSGMLQECGVKPHVALTLWRRCVCHCSPPRCAAQHPSRVISIYFYTALTAPADPLLCSVAMWAAVGGAGLFTRPTSMGNSAGVSGHRSAVGRWLLSEVSSILSLHGTETLRARGKVNLGNVAQEKRNRIAGVPWDRGSLQRVAHSRHCLVSWARPWCVQCLGAAQHCSWQCSVVGNAVLHGGWALQQPDVNPQEPGS